MNARHLFFLLQFDVGFLDEYSNLHFFWGDIMLSYFAITKFSIVIVAFVILCALKNPGKCNLACAFFATNAKINIIKYIFGQYGPLFGLSNDRSRPSTRKLGFRLIESNPSATFLKAAFEIQSCFRKFA